MNDILSFATDGTTILRQKTFAAERYKSTYERIRDRIVSGSLAHADETQFKLKGGHEGYVWALTDMEHVYFFFSKTRECDTVKELLKEFDGVLVSDFYVGYESVPCRQQKCLIHLLRDLNDDVLRQPFDEELKEQVTRFGELLHPIIKTIDNCGLKKAKLRKHQANVDAFFDYLGATTFSSNIADQYKRRFEKNRDTLFTFLNCDNVPWNNNNNNAEHAIKAFAKLRNVIQSLVGEVGITEYLVLLSVCVSCRYKEVSVLDFWRSGSEDIDEYIGGRRR